MSYILEALKKADAQRGQGQVPGLHSQHMPPEFAQTSAQGNPLLIWIIMAMGVALMGVLLWATWQPEVPSVAPAIAVPPPARAVAPISTAPTAPERPTPISPLPSEQDLPRHFRQSPSTPPSTSVAAQRAPSVHTAAPVAEAFPKLTFGGAMHSENAESRMLIVNGQLHREGDTVAPGLVLERIELKSATFRHQGQRHVVQY